MASHDDFSEEIPVTEGEPPVIRKRQNQVKFYLSDSELVRFQELQKETSLSGSALLRRWISEQQIRSTVDVQAVGEMRRQGGLFKHNAFMLGNRKIVDSKTVNELLDIAKSIFQIAKEISNGFQENTKDR